MELKFFQGGNLMIKNLDDILFRVEKPARYIGGEINSVYKDKEKFFIIL